MNKIVVICGPTATGKTQAAIDVALNFNGEVVNFDSLNFYKEISIGTAKPNLQERHMVPHHLFDIRSITNPLNAADFVREALPIIKSIFNNKRVPILTGGSGFYLQALIEGMWDSPSTPKTIQERSDQLYSSCGISPFLEELAQCDPKLYSKLHPNDHYRIRRAVEHFWTHHFPFSEAKNNFKDHGQSNWDIYCAYLDIPKEDHWTIIERRVEKMLAQGLVQEVRNLLQQGFSGLEKPLLSIGYKETLDWLNGVYSDDYRAYQERIVINTRRLAKSQRTWFAKKNKIKYDIRHESERLMADIKDFMVQE
jgi:tRNA dimethylallyltransferase